MRKLARSFSQLLMMLGKVKSALQLLTESSKGGVMLLDATLLEGSSKRTVRDALLEKHPAPSAITHSAPNPDSHVPHPVLFYAIDGPFVRSVVLKMDSAAGPSGLDATYVHAHSNSFCDSIAILTRHLATEYVDSKGIKAFVACRLIALDKCLDAKLSEARTVFQGSDILITSEGKCYLGAEIGSDSFVNSYVREKASEWDH
ncbi:hypothetical protein EMCRGX_G013831 [Ephydatia muelleri]